MYSRRRLEKNCIPNVQAWTVTGQIHKARGLLALLTAYNLIFSFLIFDKCSSYGKDEWLLAIRWAAGNDNSTSLFLGLFYRLQTSHLEFQALHNIAIFRTVLMMHLWDNWFISCYYFVWVQEERLSLRCVSLWYNRCVESNDRLCEKAWSKRFLDSFLLLPHLCSYTPQTHLSHFQTIHFFPWVPAEYVLFFSLSVVHTCLAMSLSAPVATFLLVYLICTSLYSSSSSYTEIGFGQPGEVL